MEQVHMELEIEWRQTDKEKVNEECIQTQEPKGC